MNVNTVCRPGQNAQEFVTHAHDQTVALGRALGRRMNHGLVLLLFGDLGSGKTAFAQGLANGLDVPGTFTVTSPTYTLVNEYPGRLPYYHVDLYRLPTPVDPDEIGLLDLFEENGIVAVEWAQRLHSADLPARRMELRFTVTGDTARSIRIIAYGLDPSDLLRDIDVCSTPIDGGSDSTS
jgi:tRNA threonylcarbamoyladenosine biosynthesis protein TsaE